MLLNYGVGEDSWVPWTVRTSNQSILKEISLECSLERHAEAETPTIWPPDMKSWLIGKDPDAGKDCRQEEKGMTEDEIVGWLHGLNGHEFGWTQGVGDGQGGLAYCSPWSCKESDMTELYWTEYNMKWKSSVSFQVMSDSQAPLSIEF